MIIRLQLRELYGDNDWLTISMLIKVSNRGASIQSDADISNMSNLVGAFLSNCENRVSADYWNTAHDNNHHSMNHLIITKVITLQSASNVLPCTVPWFLSNSHVQSYFNYDLSATNVVVVVYIHYMSDSVIGSISLMKTPELIHIIKTVS